MPEFILQRKVLLMDMILKIKKKHSIKSSECFSLRRYGHFVDSHLIFVYTKYSVLAAAKNMVVFSIK